MYVNGARFFDVEGAKWVAEGPALREKPTLWADDVRVERFENAGHGVYRDEPERAFAVLREFLSA